jgi:hypothetical protein
MEASGIAFHDVTREAGIRFSIGHGGRSPLNILETAGYGCAFLDADGDGWLDLLLIGPSRCALYRNQGTRPTTNDPRLTGRGDSLVVGRSSLVRFTDVTSGSGLHPASPASLWMGCATGDYDNDGRVDLLLTGYRCATLFHNEGGTFRDAGTAIPLRRDLWSTSAVFFDADDDGRLDLYVGAYVKFGQGTPQLCDFSGTQAACPPTYYDPERGRLYRNLGGGQFIDETRRAGLAASYGKTLGVAAADYDGDGRVDLYLANDGMPGELFRNQGGRFVNVGVESNTAFNYESREQAGMGVDWGDYDGDGRLDLVVTTFQYEPTSLYHNKGSGIFREEGFAAGIGDPTLSRLGFGARFFDADNDGDLDLLQANGHVQDNVAQIVPGVAYAQSAQLFENMGGRRRGERIRFRDVSGTAGAGITTPIVGRGLAVGDIDNDGDLDLLIANLEGAPRLLWNESPRRGHAVTLRLVGRRSPRDGTGARVTLRAGGRLQTREAGTGGSYLSAGDPRVHFGLGTATTAESVTIRWPSGARQTLRSIPAGREVTVIEPAG